MHGNFSSIHHHVLSQYKATRTKSEHYSITPNKLNLWAAAGVSSIKAKRATKITQLQPLKSTTKVSVANGNIRCASAHSSIIRIVCFTEEGANDALPKASKAKFTSLHKSWPTWKLSVKDFKPMEFRKLKTQARALQKKTKPCTFAARVHYDRNSRSKTKFPAKYELLAQHFMRS